jgi:hypothetical protein
MKDAQFFRPSTLQHMTRVSCVVLLTMLCSATRADTLAEVQQLVDAGQFNSAEAQIAKSLAQPSLASADRQALTFERERMRRIRLDFSLSAEDAQSRLRRQIPDLTPAEFAAWDAAGLLEHQVIDGRMLYFNRAPSNLFRLSEAALKRRSSTSPPWTDGPMEIANAHHREVRDQALKTGRPGVAPRQVRVTYSLTVNADAVPNGETVRAWLPFPRALPGQQENVRLLESTPATHVIAPESALQRTVYLEKTADAGKPTLFSITYELTVFGQFHAIDAAKVKPVTRTAALAPDLAQRPPHIVFTPAIRKYSREIVGTERNPFLIAQKLFAAVDRIPWAGAREYSTISNISDYALHAGHADCGQQTLLLMTLLRLNGIPTRWQSGWVYSEEPTTTCTTGGSSIYRPTAGCPWTSRSGASQPAIRRSMRSTSVGSMPTASRSTTISASRSYRPNSTPDPTPSIHNAAKSNGVAAISISISGITSSKHTCSP